MYAKNNTPDLRRISATRAVCNCEIQMNAKYVCFHNHDPAGVSEDMVSTRPLDNCYSTPASMPSLPKVMRSKLPKPLLSSVLCRNESKSKFSNTSGPSTAKSNAKLF